MSLAALGIIMVALTASPGDAVTVSLWAMDASVEGRSKDKHFDRELAPIRDTVRDLPFDTFSALKVVRAQVPPEQEKEIPINERYTLYLTPHAKTPEGILRLSIRVEKMPEKPARKNAKPVNAFSTHIEIKAGQKIKFTGLKNGDKELVIVLEAV